MLADGNRRLLIVDHTFEDLHGHHFEYNVSLADAAFDLGLSPMVLANRKCELDSASDKYSIVPWFRYSWYGADTDGATRTTTFAEELLTYLEQEVPSPDDLVLIHTLAMSEFTQLLSHFRQALWHEVASFPTIYIVLRRDPDESTSERLAEARKLLHEAFRCPDLDRKIVLCTDTEELSGAWAEALNCKCITLPIPFRHGLIDADRPARPEGSPLSVIYLGDARTEKGYHHLPQMVFSLWDNYIGAGRASCVFQSNYNLPGGEGGIREARMRLQQFPRNVRLITDLLSPEDYYRILSDGDIVVLPYDPERYGRRSSGVLNEAVVAGKVAVVPVGTWLANQVSPDGAVVYEHPRGLAEAVAYAIDHFDELSTAARLHAPRHAAKHSAELLIRALLDAAAGGVGAAGPSMLFVMDGDSVSNRTGAGAVALNQLEAFTSLGYAVHAVFQRMHVDNDHNLLAMRDWMASICDRVRPFRLASVWGAGYAPFQNRAGLFQEQRAFSERGRSLLGAIRYRNSFAVPAGLLERLRSDPPELAFVNYVQSIPFARELAGASVPLICESVDVQSFQFALQGKRDVDLNELESEMRLLREADHVITLSRFEAQYLSNHIPPERVTFIPQPSRDQPSRPETLAGITDLAQLVRACGPSHWLFHEPPTRFVPSPAPLEVLRAASEIDLLYVSSRHAPNLHGIQLFFHHIFFPILEPRGVTIAIAGDICEDLSALNNPHVLLAYRVESLAPLYAAAKMVILPILDGAGSAIKTLDALANAKPVVATSYALRGISFDQLSFPTFDDWDAFGARILELLEDPELRLAASVQSRELSRNNGNDGGYPTRLNSVVTNVLGPKALPSVAVEPELEEPVIVVEWNRPISCFNQLLLDWMSDGCLSIQAMRAFRRDPQHESVAREMFEAFAIRRDTPAQLRGIVGELPEFDEGESKDAFFRFWRELTEEVDAPATSQDGPPGEIRFHVADGVAAELRVEAPDRGTEVLWQSQSQRHGTRHPGGIWSVEDSGGVPLLTQHFRQPSAKAGPSHAMVFATNFFHGEPSHDGMGNRIVARWTGPGTESFIVLAFRATHETVVLVDVADILAPEAFESARLSINGVSLPTLKWSVGQRRGLTALLMGSFLDGGRGRVRLGIHVNATVRPSDLVGSADTRALGLKIGEIHMETVLGDNHARVSVSAFQQVISQMAERGPEGFVYGCYRDLFGRSPDPGSRVYVEMAAEGKYIEVVEGMVLSPEFRLKVDIPGYGEALVRHLHRVTETRRLIETVN